MSHPLEPTPPTDPAVPVDQADPPHQADPSEPADPTEPAEPTEPAGVAEPAEPAESMQPTEPVEAAEPAEAAEAAESTEPTDPSEPADPTEPAEPEPTQVPGSPAEPPAPVEPPAPAEEPPAVLGTALPEALLAPPVPAELVAPLAPLPVAAPLPEEDSASPASYDVGGPARARDNGVALAVLSFVAVALLLLTGWLGYQVADARGPAPVEASRASALDAGRDAARLVFSYDYRHLAKDFAAAEATTTGEFKKEYANTTKKLVSDVAPRYKAVLLAEVSEAGVVTVSEEQVVLLVFMDVQSTSTLAATPKITPRRLKMTMQRHGSRWLVSKVDAF